MMRACSILLFCLLVSVLSGGAAQADRAKTEKVKPALLVIDIQNEFLPLMSEQDKKSALEYIDGAVRRFHDQGLPVIRIYHTNPGGGPKPGSEAFEFTKSVSIRPDDPMIVKNYGNAFNKTGLEKRLRDLGCNTLFLCGLSATGCVLATYIGAEDLDFDVFMIREALISPDSSQTRFVQDICEIVSYGALKTMLKAVRE